MNKFTGTIKITALGDRTPAELAKTITDCLTVQCSGLYKVEVDLGEGRQDGADEAGQDGPSELTSDEAKAKAEILDRLKTTHLRLHDCVNVVNASYQKLWDRLQGAADEYNDAVREANRWMMDVHDRLERVAAGKSQRWLNSEAGDAFCEWTGTYDNEIFEADFGDMPDEIALSEVEFSDFESLQDAPDDGEVDESVKNMRTAGPTEPDEEDVPF